MKKAILLYISIFLFATSCQDNNKNATAILGNWKGVVWLANGQPSGHNANELTFEFNDKKEYSMNYENTKEAGTYKVENDMLFTTAKGQMEIMVKIEKLTNDSLIFRMNNSGQDEQLTLIRSR